MQADNEAAIRKAHAERERILKEAKELGDRYIADAKRAAIAETDKVKAEAREAIQAEKAAALKEIKSSVAEMSVLIAEKLLRAELSIPGKQQQLVNEMFKNMKLN
jgi:F-type H+-transporting ATPase subunit b